MLKPTLKSEIALRWGARHLWMYVLLIYIEAVLSTEKQDGAGEL